MLKNTFLGLSIVLGVISCTSPQSASNSAQSSSTALKELSTERWASAKKGRITTYPPLARLAGISGDVVMRLSINEQGKVTDAKLVSGPPQLAAAVDRFARSIQFVPEPTYLPGPWQFSITARFDLAGLVGVAPTGQPVILEPVSTPAPSAPAGLR